MKLRTTTVAVVALMLGMVAGPALAQDPEVLEAEECLIAVLVGPANFLPEDEFPVPETDDFGEIVDLDGYFAANPGIVADFLALLADLDVAVADICEIGGTYVPDTDVLGVVFERPPSDDEIDAVVAQPVDPPSAAVLGVQLARTGMDAAIIALIGVGLLGLGIVAVRGTRGRADVA